MYQLCTINKTVNEIVLGLWPRGNFEKEQMGHVCMRIRGLGCSRARARVQNCYLKILTPQAYHHEVMGLGRFKSLAKPWIWNSARSIISTFFEGPDFKTTKWGRNRKWKWRLRHRMPSFPDGNATYRGGLTDCMRNNTKPIVKWKHANCAYACTTVF